MNKILNQTETYNSWVLEMPKEIAEKEGYNIGTRVVLTFENGSIKTEVIPPISAETKKEVSRLIKKYDQTFQHFKENGD
jgi:antitoxin component of MazEF toxin-antitoxin module